MTYSIVARDTATGELGVAVQSHFFAVGPVVPWLRPGVGAVATQAMAEVSYGPLALDLLVAGRSPERALEILTEADPGAATRQVGVVDATGAVAVHTGECCIAEAGHVVGEGWAVLANMMTSPGVPDAMADAFLAADGHLADRMLAALDAAEDTGGDIRGRQSAALVVVRGDAGSPVWDNVYDVRVDDHPEPLDELRRLVGMRRAYRTGAADDPVLGDNPEVRFWSALRRAAAGEVAEARAILDPIYAADERWRELVRRLPAAGSLPDDPALVAALTD